MAAAAALIVLTLPSDSTPRTDGPQLAFDLVWLGVVFGLVDALLLNVLPMMAIWSAVTGLGWNGTWRGRIGLGYVFVPNPLTAVVAHVILHVASVLTGSEGPVQLPPHS